MEILTVHAPAKVNLSLAVRGIRPDGYHELDMLMQAVSLYETVILQKAKAISLICRSADGALAADIPTDSRNLAFRAAQLFFKKAGIPGGVQLEIIKAVPSQAGMAGGSADAAGVLWGLNVLYGTNFSLSNLCEWGSDLGSDVPFCLIGGTARVKGRGELVKPLSPLTGCFLVAVMPPQGVSTPVGFARYDASPMPVQPDVDRCAAAICRQELSEVFTSAGNALQQACSGPDTANILHTLQLSGAKAQLLTGTGAVCYGLFDREDTARSAAALLSQKYPRTYFLQPESRGPHCI